MLGHMSLSKPPLECSVRHAVVNDVPLILQLIRELAEYERLSHAVSATEEGLRDHLFGARPAAEVIIGELNHRPAGFALFFHNFSTFLGKSGIYLEDIYVRPDARGRGLGTALLKHIAQLAVQRGCGRLDWAVLDWNEPAIRFYQRLGAVAMDQWTMYRLTGDALIRFSQIEP
jgi:GNAT superfamily N-acetyltransferase